MRLKETPIPGEIKTTAATDMGYDVDPNDIEPFYMCLCTATAKFLSLQKDPSNKKTALRFDDYKGNMYVAAVVEYMEEEDPQMPGNWTYYFTFNPEDLSDAVVHEASNIGFHKVLADVTLNIMHYHYISTTWEDTLIRMAVEYLINCLDKNANEAEKFVIDLPEYFTASVEVVDGVKVMAIEPSAKMGQLIKGDDMISK